MNHHCTWARTEPQLDEVDEFYWGAEYVTVRLGDNVREEYYNENCR